MNLGVIAVGKLKERFWREACDEYLKRLKAYDAVAVQEVPDENPAHCNGPEGALEREGAGILARLRPQDYVVLCASDGVERTSPQLAQRLESWLDGGMSSVVFVIGGSWGVSEAVRARADETLSFGRLTLPHNLARVVLLEQIYRSWRILRHEPYHK